jgi:hypothetical protein
VATSDDIVYLSIRRKWSAQVDEQSSAWMSRGISTKESLKKEQWQWIASQSMLTHASASWVPPSSE